MQLKLILEIETCTAQGRVEYCCCLDISSI